MKIYHICQLCNVKTYDWDKHINTKRHIKNRKNFRFMGGKIDDLIIDSPMIAKYTPPIQFLPRVKFNPKNNKWRTKK